MAYVATMLKTSKEISELSKMYQQIDINNNLGKIVNVFFFFFKSVLRIIIGDNNS